MNINMLKSDYFLLGDFTNMNNRNIPHNTQFNIINFILNIFPFFNSEKEIIKDNPGVNDAKRNLNTHDEMDIERNKNNIKRLENNQNNNNCSLNKNITDNLLKKEEKKENLKFIINKENNKKEDVLNNFPEDELNNTIKEDDKVRNNKYLKINIFKSVDISFNKNINNINNELIHKDSDIKNVYLNKKRLNNYKFDNNIYIPDNYLKTIRVMILDCLIKFINNKIKIFKNNKINFSLCRLQFCPINKERIYHSNVEFDKKFLNLQLKVILSGDISNKYTNFLRDTNSQLVQTLISSENGDYFRELFDLTFLDCLEYIRGTKNSILFDGFPKIEEIIQSKKKNMNKKEIERFKNYINNYEKGLSSKISRFPKKQLKND